MRYFLWLLLVLGFCLAGCRSNVVYDDYIESFRYKPESEWDYITNLGPTQSPVVSIQGAEK
jgi:hypothetical protein